MNFLEKLAAEWYEYQGYFVRSNIHFGKREKGGWTGEIDVAAFHPKSREFIHLEVSTDALNWNKRIPRFKWKFDNASLYYNDLFPFQKGTVKKIVVVGFSAIPKHVAISQVEIKSIPHFVSEICADLQKKRPLNSAVPENYSLLRAIQFAVNYQSTTGSRR